MESADTRDGAGDRPLQSPLHVLLSMGCRCVAVCVERNKEFAEVAQASFPQSVHLKFVAKLDPEPKMSSTSC